MVVLSLSYPSLGNVLDQIGFEFLLILEQAGTMDIADYNVTHVLFVLVVGPLNAFDCNLFSISTFTAGGGSWETVLMDGAASSPDFSVLPFRPDRPH